MHFDGCVDLVDVGVVSKFESEGGDIYSLGVRRCGFCFD